MTDQNYMMSEQENIIKKCIDAGRMNGKIFEFRPPAGISILPGALFFATSYAEAKGINRIIYITSHPDDAKRIKEFIGNESDIITDIDIAIDEEEPEFLRKKELDAEPWDAPVIITDIKKYLMTLFSGDSFFLKNVHSMCKSIVIISDMRDIPKKMRALFNLSVNFFSEICDTIFLLCSHLPIQTTDTEHPLIRIPIRIIERDDEIWKKAKKPKINNIGGKTHDEICESAIKESEEGSVVIICNTESSVQYICDKFAKENVDHICMTAEISAKQINEKTEMIFQKTESKENVICVTINKNIAAYGLHFDKAIRFAAGLDDIVTTAEISSQIDVVICLDEDLRNMPEIREGKSIYIEMTADNTKKYDLASDEAVNEFRKRFNNRMPTGYDECFIKHASVLDLLSDNTGALGNTVSKYACNQAFRTAGRLLDTYIWN